VNVGIDRGWRLMATKRGFPRSVTAAIAESKILGIRAGSGDHHFIGVWVVVVDGRVFIRSWGLKRRSWYNAFLERPMGTIQVGDRELRVRAITDLPERIKAAVDAAYAEKYDTPGAIKYVKGFARSKRRRDTTTELLPALAPSRGV
jgi:hypothetical protein